MLLELRNGTFTSIITTAIHHGSDKKNFFKMGCRTKKFQKPWPMWHASYYVQCGPTAGPRKENSRPVSFLSVDLMLCVCHSR